ncbi:hypothetical protein FRC18_004851 [Serendipita sp. 400]|nr:hypothetical protein FRC18_004851 [Serendipita sp. 400]
MQHSNSDLGRHIQVEYRNRDMRYMGSRRRTAECRAHYIIYYSPATDIGQLRRGTEQTSNQRLRKIVFDTFTDSRILSFVPIFRAPGAADLPVGANWLEENGEKEDAGFWAV